MNDYQIYNSLTASQNLLKRKPSNKYKYFKVHFKYKYFSI